MGTLEDAKLTLENLTHDERMILSLFRQATPAEKETVNKILLLHQQPEEIAI